MEGSLCRAEVDLAPFSIPAIMLVLRGAGQHLETPFFGSRRMKAWLERRGVRMSRKRLQGLMRAMGLRAIYQRTGTSRRAPEHPVYPYLLRNVRITRPNQSLPPRRRGVCRFPRSLTR